MTFVGNDIISLVTGGVLELKDAAAIPPIISGDATELDTEVAEAIVEVLEELGKTLQFRVDPEGVFSQSESSFTAGEPVYYGPKAIPPYEFQSHFIDGDLVRLNDLQTGIAGYGLEFELTPGTLKRIQVTVDTIVYKIVRVLPIYSGERVALYLLQLRA